MPTPPRKLTHAGETLTLSQWAKRTGLSPETIRSRIDHQGWDVDRALTTPAERKFSARSRPPANVPRACPRLKRHAGTDQAYVRWRDRGKKHFRYFGAWGSEQAAEGYRRFQTEWVAGLQSAAKKPGQTVFVKELIAGYFSHVKDYYVKGGKPTSEVSGHVAAVRVLNELYGTLPADEFSPTCLRACVTAMVAKGWVRKSINRHQWRIVRCFRWGVGQELVHPDVHARLKAVDYLKRGRTAAAERPKVKPVPLGDVEAIIPHLSDDAGRRALLETAIRFHLLTGMRPGELTGMRAEDVNTTEGEWLYTVPAHINKNEHRDKPQWYWLGPKARAVLRPLLDNPGPGGRLWCFPPKGKKGTKRTPISRGAYAEAVRRACDAAGVKRWHPHQLRHNYATAVQREYESNNAAAAAIGDTPAVAAEVYIDPLDKVRRRIAREMG